MGFSSGSLFAAGLLSEDRDQHGRLGTCAGIKEGSIWQQHPVSPWVGKTPWVVFRAEPCARTQGRTGGAAASAQSLVKQI